MDLHGYLSILRRRWTVIIACVVAGLCVGGAVVVTSPKRYQSTVRLFVNIPAARSTGEALQGVQLSAQLMQSYADISNSRTSSAAISSRLGGAVSPQEVRRSVSAEPQADTLLIDVTARSDDAEGARDLANAAAQTLSETITGLEDGNAAPVQARIVDPAVAAASPSSPRPKKDVAGGLAGGLALGLLIAFAVEALRARPSSDAPETSRLEPELRAEAQPDRRLDDALTTLAAVSASVASIDERLRSFEPPAPARPRPRKAAPTTVASAPTSAARQRRARSS